MLEPMQHSDCKHLEVATLGGYTHLNNPDIFLKDMLPHYAGYDLSTLSDSISSFEGECDY